MPVYMWDMSDMLQNSFEKYEEINKMMMERLDKDNKVDQVLYWEDPLVRDDWLAIADEHVRKGDKIIIRW